MVLRVIAHILIVIGALNWGLWGFFEFDLVSWIFGGNTTVGAKVIYDLVGIAGLVGLTYFCKVCHCCNCKKKCDNKKH